MAATSAFLAGITLATRSPLISDIPAVARVPFPSAPPTPCQRRSSRLASQPINLTVRPSKKGEILAMKRLGFLDTNTGGNNIDTARKEFTRFFNDIVDIKNFPALRDLLPAARGLDDEELMATIQQASAMVGGRQLAASPSSSNDHVKHGAIGEEDSGEECEEDSDEEYANSTYYSRIANRLSDEEKGEIINLASIRPDNPVFVTVLQMSHVQRRNSFLIFPSRFVADHLDSKLHEITFVRPNKKDKWCVKHYHTRDAQGVRNYNFSMFVQDNRLRQGDICVFELMKGARRVTMTVHVIRKVDGRFVLVG
ncbi:hypothetical protein HU200_014917 [Digitaria exilis]|uniref:TF-B3 domain-containing protein n=1 Tax=Digitaria exilis TaxID=1010633 RepID=A0A835KJT8_9POAL|nr:hypothetical protein HU200_014917 [Digitaria exilis]